MLKRKFLLLIIVFIFSCGIITGCSQKPDLSFLDTNANATVFEALSQAMSKIQSTIYNPLDKGTEAVNGGEIIVNMQDANGNDINCVISRDSETGEMGTLFKHSDGRIWRITLKNKNIILQPDANKSVFYELPLENMTETLKKSEAPNAFNMEAADIEKLIRKNYSLLLEQYASGATFDNGADNLISSLKTILGGQNASTFEGTITINGDSVKTAAVKYEITGEALNQIVSAVKKWFKAKDSAYSAYINDIFYEMFADAGCDLREDKYYKDDTKSTIERTLLSISSLSDEYEVATSVECHLDPSTHSLLRVDISARSVDKEIPVQISLGIAFNTNTANESSIVCDYAMIGDGNLFLDVKAKLTYTLESSAESVKKIILYEYSDEVINWKNDYRFELDKRNNAYEIKSLRDNHDLIIRGAVRALTTEIEMSIAEIEYREQVHSINAQIKGICKKVPSAVANTTKILSMGNSQLKNFLNEITKNYPETIIGDWDVAYIDINNYYKFNPNYDYNMDGICGDQADYAVFEYINSKLKQ